MLNSILRGFVHLDFNISKKIGTSGNIYFEIRWESLDFKIPEKFGLSGN